MFGARRAQGGGGRGFPWLRAGLLVFLTGLVALMFTPVPGKVKRGLREILRPPRVAEKVDEGRLRRRIEGELRAEYEARLGRDLERELAVVRAQVAAEVRRELEDSTKPVVPEIEVPGKVSDVRQLRSGIPFKSEVVLAEGGEASKERVDPGSFEALYRLSVRVPAAVATMAGLEKTSPKLGSALPGMAAMVAGGKVSPWYRKIYDNKLARIRSDATLLNELITKHNYYDCETILHLQAPGGRRVFFLQAEMDVVSDGSDGDRLPVMPAAIVDSTHYQPFTSYGWAKRGKGVNPMIAGWERRIVAAEKELGDRGTTAARKQWLRDRVGYLKRGIADMKVRSFLIAEHDPFIVMPVPLLVAKNDPFAPKAGDYAVVVHDGVLYPALVGDGGPTYKVGEASLRMARQINPRAGPYSRPVSDLKVSYVVFPGSADPERGPPDYGKWRERCKGLLEEIGGIGSGHVLFEWQDTLPQPVQVASDKAADDRPGEGPSSGDKPAGEKPAGERPSGGKPAGPGAGGGG